MLILSCGQVELATPTFHTSDNPKLLSDWNILQIQSNQLTLTKDVLPYDLNSPLFSDYAHKLRTVWIPKNTSIKFDPDQIFELPVGSIISKTFYYPKTANKTSNQYSINLNEITLIETRLLLHRKEGWVALPYVWNDQQTEATLKRTGDIKALKLRDSSHNIFPFNYIVPDANQCAGCHATNATTRELTPIGLKARHLNKPFEYLTGSKNQLNAWNDMSVEKNLLSISAYPKNAAWNDKAYDLKDRARAYLDINCSHCHNKVGPADTSGLLLEPNSPDGRSLGICKLPIAAGTGTGNREFGIVPGEPEESIMLFRMESTNPAVMMPELGRSLAHSEGVELIANWVGSLEGHCD